MILATIEIDVRIYDSYSLKEKRSVIKSVIRRLQNKFNISISEINNLDKLNYSTIGVATISNDLKVVDGTVEKVVNFIDNDDRLEIISIKKEIY